MPSPALRRKQLASRLKDMRTKTGITLEEAGKALEVSAATMSRIENGHRLPRARDVRDLSQLYGADDATTARLVSLVEASKESGWWEQYTELGEAYATLIDFESAATSIGEYRGLTVPGLLQTPGYIRAYLLEAINPGREDPFTERGIADRTKVALKRQEILTSPRLTYTAFLDEAIVRRLVGGPEVMAGQLAHLVALGNRDWISIRLIPFDAGAHPGQPGGFCLLGLPSDVGSDVVYVDSLAGQLFLDTPGDVTRHRHVLEKLDSLALTPTETQEAFDIVGRTYRG